MNSRALLALTSHGNAPYLMAARFAKALGNIPIVIPHYYHGIQSAILLEEIPESAGQIFLSKELGDLLRPLLWDASIPASFAQFGSWLANPQNPRGANALENQLDQMLKDGIAAESLDGTIRRRFYQKDLSAVINTAQPLRVNLPRSYFFFTAKMSDLYGLVPEGDLSEETHKTADDLKPYSEIWKKVEESFDCAFIPRINAFSYRSGQSADHVIHTPPFAFRRELVHTLERKSILFVPSGTRTDIIKLRRIAESIPANYDLLVLGKIGMNGDFPEEQFGFVGAKVYSDPLLAGVISRGGWGTIWECLANQKPSAMVRTTFGEDPEMGHTQRTMEQLGLASILNDSYDGVFEEKSTEGILSAMQQIGKEDIHYFGSYADDGYGYIAKKIHDIHGLT